MKDLERNIAVTLVLHLASLTAVGVYYRRQLLSLVMKDRREIALLFVATLPIVFVGALLGKQIEFVHAMPAVICALLIANGVFLYLGDRLGHGEQRLAEAPWWKIFAVGLAQAVRLPGLSRSGSTIGTGWLVGLDRVEAVRFSFLLSIPAVLGAVAWKARKLDVHALSLPLLPTLLALVITFTLSLISIRIVETLAMGRRWLIFAAYSVMAGTAGLIFFLLR